jgi:hypothetical protein
MLPDFPGPTDVEEAARGGGWGVSPDFRKLDGELDAKFAWPGREALMSRFSANIILTKSPGVQNNCARALVGDKVDENYMNVVRSIL